MCWNQCFNDDAMILPRGMRLPTQLAWVLSMLKPSMAGASSRRGSAGPDQEMLVPITRLPIVAANIYTNNDQIFTKSIRLGYQAPSFLMNNNLLALGITTELVLKIYSDSRETYGSPKFTGMRKLRLDQFGEAKPIQVPQHWQCRYKQCCGSVTFWYGSGSGSADPYHWLTDPDHKEVSKQCCESECLSRIRIFFHPGSRLRIKEFKCFTPKKLILSSRKIDPGCSSRIRIPEPGLICYPSRISG